MNKKQEIENLLKSFANLIENSNYYLSFDTVYYYLTKYGVNPNENNFQVNSLFSDWIDYFKDNLNIRVFLQHNWRYFCQFVNYQKEDTNNLFNPIKMYISCDSFHIKETAKILFEFMANSNIYHESKIGSEIRNDDIVIRVFTKGDAKKISDFVNNNEYIKSGMKKISPFTLEEKGIGYVLDGHISYNMTISKYIVDYINKCKTSNTLNRVSFDDFYNYIENIYNQTFIKRENISDYYTRFCDRSNYTREVVLNDYYEVTKLILSNLKGNTFNKFLSLVDEFNNKEKVNKNIESFQEKKEIIINNENIELFNEYILVMYKKYGYEMAYKTVLEYINTGNIDRVTRTNDLRIRFQLKMNPDICKVIMNNLSFDEYFNEIVKLSVKNSNRNDFISQEDIDLFNEYIYVMNAKYGYEAAYSTILEYLKTGNIYKVTSTNNLRNRLQEKMNNQKANIIVKNDLKNYMYNYIKYNLYLTKLYLDRAIVGTFIKYNDLEQVSTAIKYAFHGEYGYFTNQNGERENLIKYVNPVSIKVFFNTLLNTSIDDYIKKCLDSYQLNYESNLKNNY